jgi:hypothetical protein
MAKRGHPQFYALIDEIVDLHARKNQDYARDDDPLSNFRQAEALGVPAWLGVLVRMSDKWSRIQELVKGKTPQNESLRDSLIDLAVYALIDIILLEAAAPTTITNGTPRSSPASAVAKKPTSRTPTGRTSARGVRRRKT